MADWSRNVGPSDPHHVALSRAACEYAERGWPIVPGSAWNGRRYTRAHADIPAGDLAPIWPLERATSRLHQVWRWWRMAPYSVLAACGALFDVIAAPTTLVARALASAPLEAVCGPVARSSARSWLVVEPGVGLRSALAEVYGVELLSVGATVPLPPTMTRTGPVTWQGSPDAYDWTFANSHLVQSALLAAVDHAAASDAAPDAAGAVTP